MRNLLSLTDRSSELLQLFVTFVLHLGHVRCNIGTPHAASIGRPKMTRLSKVAEYRLMNLRALIQDHGGPLELGKKLGYSNASFLVQMAGPNPIRSVTEKTARRFEMQLGLPEGALDKSMAGVSTYLPAKGSAVPVAHVPAPVAPEPAPQADVALVADLIRMVGRVCEEQKVQPSAAKFAELVAIALLDTNQQGVIREGYVASLVKLLA